MKNTFNRLTGSLLIFAAIGGLVFSILGLVGVWQYRPGVTNTLTGNIKLLRTTMESTAEGLTLMQESLTSALTSITVLNETLSTTTEIIQSSEPMIDVVVELLDEDIPQTIRATQSSLSTVQQSAKVIDGFLSALSRVPFLGVNYANQIPLSVALQQVSSSLNSLPGTMAEMADSLEDTGQNLKSIQVDLALIAESMRQVEASLAESEALIEEYQQTVAILKIQLDISEQKLPNLIQNTSMGLSIFFVWMAIAQIGLFRQGWEILRPVGSPRTEETEGDG